MQSRRHDAQKMNDLKDQEASEARVLEQIDVNVWERRPVFQPLLGLASLPVM